MQHPKKFNVYKFIFELRNLNTDIIVNYKCGRVTAIIPIRKESGVARYKLKLAIDTYGNCNTYIIEPKIKKYNDKNPPHTYILDSKWKTEKQQFDELKLCLYLPGSGEYDKKDSLIESIISWAIKWTEFYEIWLLTGEWFGGGKHPTKEIDKINKSV